MTIGAAFDDSLAVPIEIIGELALVLTRPAIACGRNRCRLIRAAPARI